MENEGKKLFWAPSVIWKINNEGQLQIENYIFYGGYEKLFPEFYFYTGEGIDYMELMKRFKSYDVKWLEHFIHLLIKRRLLISHVQETEELYYSQGIVFRRSTNYDDSIFFDKEKLNGYVKEKLHRKVVEVTQKITLIKTENQDKNISERESVRCFDTSKVIDFNNFSGLLSTLRQHKPDEKIKYDYPSAGGLYPIDCYIYVKKDRVSQISNGLYYYSPEDHELKFINPAKDIDKNAHYFLNQNIFDTSAFSIYFVYDTLVSMPKYRGMAYYYAALDTGIMMELLSIQSLRYHIGSCIIGEMDFQKIRHNFMLDDTKKYMCCMEFGIKEEAKDE